MNRETRRMIEREERRQKSKEKSEGRGPGGRAPGRVPSRTQGGGTAGGSTQPLAEKQALFRRIADYLHEVRVEMRKVSWPTREQMVVFTAVTMITSVALTILVFGLDFGLKTAVLWVIDGGIGG